MRVRVGVRVGFRSRVGVRVRVGARDPNQRTYADDGGAIVDLCLPKADLMRILSAVDTQYSDLNWLHMEETSGGVISNIPDEKDEFGGFYNTKSKILDEDNDRDWQSNTTLKN